MDNLKRMERIGRGTFGEVYKAVDESGLVAVKVIPLDGLASDIDEIQQEIRLLSRCDHVNIIKYRRTVVDKNRLWIVMDFCEHGSDNLGPIPEKAAAYIGKEVLNAITYLHENSIVHRDIKAANILLTEEGGVRLGDFGVSTNMTPGNGGPLKVAGSPYWMAPEVIRRTRFDSKADIWSFGITMIELVGGAPPLWQLEPGKAMRTIAKSMPPRLELPSVSKELRDLVNACLHDDPDKRPTAKDLLKCKILKVSKAGPLLELIKKSTVVAQQQSDHQSLLSRVTNLEQEITDDYWNFNEVDNQDPLVEKYFGTEKEDEQNNAASLEQVITEEGQLTVHQRSESQSSNGLSVGTSSLLESELDLSASIEATLTNSISKVQLEENAHRPSRTASLLSINTKGETESVEDGGILRLFPRLKFSAVNKEEWLKGKDLLFKIKDLQEIISSPIPICAEPETRKFIKAQLNRTVELSLLINEADSLINSKLSS